MARCLLLKKDTINQYESGIPFTPANTDDLILEFAYYFNTDPSAADSLTNYDLDSIDKIRKTQYLIGIQVTVMSMFLSDPLSKERMTR